MLIVKHLKSFPAEKRDLEFYRRRETHDALIHHVITLDNFLDFDRLSRAVQLTFIAEPYLGCHFIDNFPWPYWKRRDDLNTIQSCKIIHTTNTQEELKRIIPTPIIDLYSEPHIQVYVIRSQTDTLCIKTNHMISDGIGCLEYISILSKIYRKLKNNPKYKPEINENGSRNLKQAAKNFHLRDRIKIIHSGIHNWKNDLFPRANWSFPYKHLDKEDKGFIIKKFNSNKLDATKNYARKKKVSFNDILLTSFYHTLFSMVNPNPNTPLRVILPVDYRKYIFSGKGEAICNLAGTFQFNIGNKIGNNFEETLKKITKRMNYYKNNYMGLTDYSYIFYNLNFLPFSWIRKLNDQFLKINQLICHGMIPPGYSNIGKIDSKYYEFDDINVIDAYITDPIMHPPMFLPVISSFGGNITVYIGFSGAKKNRVVMEDFLNLFEQNLPS